MCSLGFMVKVGVFESGEICWNTLWWADSSPCLAFVVALSSDGREVHRHAQREARGRRVWVFCVKSRAIFILAVALENWNIYDSVLKQEAFSILGCGLSCVQEWRFSPFLLDPFLFAVLRPTHLLPLSRGLFAAQPPSLGASQAIPLQREGNVTSVYIMGTRSSHLSWAMLAVYAAVSGCA